MFNMTWGGGGSWNIFFKKSYFCIAMLGNKTINNVNFKMNVYCYVTDGKIRVHYVQKQNKNTVHVRITHHIVSHALSWLFVFV